MQAYFFLTPQQKLQSRFFLVQFPEVVHVDPWKWIKELEAHIGWLIDFNRLSTKDYFMPQS